MYNIIILY